MLKEFQLTVRTEIDGKPTTYQTTFCTTTVDYAVRLAKLWNSQGRRTGHEYYDLMEIRILGREEEREYLQLQSSPVPLYSAMLKKV